MVYLAGLGMLPRYYYQLGHRSFLRFSFGFPWKAAKSLSHRGTVRLAGLGVLPRYIYAPLHLQGLAGLQGQKRTGLKNHGLHGWRELRTSWT